MTTLKFKYKVSEYQVTAETVNLLTPVHQRALRDTQVKSLLRGLLDGDHFEAPLVVNVNKTEKIIRVIDGAHRTEAMKRYFKTRPNDIIIIAIMSYTDLTEDEERLYYRRWNRGGKQTANDYIESFKDVIDVLPYMERELPVSVYGSNNKFKIKHLIDAYVAAKQTPFTGGDVLSPINYVEILQKFNESDVDDIKENFDAIMEIFNPTGVTDFTRLPAFKMTNFVPLYHLIQNNKVMLGRYYVVKRIRTALYNKSDMMESAGYGRQSWGAAYHKFKEKLNRGDVAKKFS